MVNDIKVYSINDFIRKKATGEIDFDKSIEMVHELAFAANFHPDHNILVDMRETTLKEADMSSLLKLAFEVVRYESCFKNKIANLIPDDPDRISVAKKFYACLDSLGFEYEFFVSYEAAIEWLSDVSDLSGSTK